MLLYKQLDLFETAERATVEMPGSRPGCIDSKPIAIPCKLGRDEALENQGRQLLRPLGAHRIATTLRVVWDPRLRTSAGRADCRRGVVTLNPRLREHGATEVDRTLRHELAHLLAQSRSGRRRVTPHGEEWRRACHDLGIPDERRCHSLPFPVQARQRRYLYRCPGCAKDFPRVHRIRRGLACLSCCRRYNRGRYDKRFQLRLVEPASNA